MTTGKFKPLLVKKHQRRIVKFDDLVISLYTRGMTQEQSARICTRSMGYLIRSSLR